MKCRGPKSDCGRCKSRRGQRLAFHRSRTIDHQTHRRIGSLPVDDAQHVSVDKRTPRFSQRLNCSIDIEITTISKWKRTETSNLSLRCASTSRNIDNDSLSDTSGFCPEFRVNCITECDEKRYGLIRTVSEQPIHHVLVKFANLRRELIEMFDRCHLLPRDHCAGSDSSRRARRRRG